MSLASSFCSWSGLSMNAVSPGHTLRWENYLPTTCPRCSSDFCFTLYVHRLFACLFSKNSTMPSGLYPSQICWPLKFQTLSPADCQKSQNLYSFSFQANYCGDSFSLRALLCAILSLALLCNCGSLCTAAAMIHFSPKLCLHTSYLFLCGLFSPFIYKICSASLEASFWDIKDDLMVI